MRLESESQKQKSGVSPPFVFSVYINPKMCKSVSRSQTLTQSHQCFSRSQVTISVPNAPEYCCVANIFVLSHVDREYFSKAFVTIVFSH